MANQWFYFNHVSPLLSSFNNKNLWDVICNSGLTNIDSTSGNTAPPSFPQVKPSPSSVCSCLLTKFGKFGLNRKMQSSSSRPRPPHLLTNLMRVIEQIPYILAVMLQQHFSHATGWSGMWMTASWEANLYSYNCDAHARACLKKKKKKGGDPNSQGAFTAIPQLW